MRKKVMLIILLMLLMGGFFIAWFWIIGNRGLEGNGGMQLLNLIRR